MTLCWSGPLRAASVGGRSPSLRSLLHAHISFRLVCGAPAGPATSRSAPLSSPRPPSPTACTHLGSVTSQRTPPTVAPAPEPGPMSSSRTRSGTLTRATAAAGGEQAQPLKLPPGPRLGPGSGSGATKEGAERAVTGPASVLDTRQNEMCESGSLRSRAVPRAAGGRRAAIGHRRPAGLKSRRCSKDGGPA